MNIHGELTVSVSHLRKYQIFSINIIVVAQIISDN